MLRRWKVLYKEHVALQMDVLVAKLEDRAREPPSLGWLDSDPGAKLGDSGSTGRFMKFWHSSSVN
jgi:hypothetical protein